MLNIRYEHPRPDRRRDNYLNLNGIWSFSFATKEFGEKKQWYKNDNTLEREITVPFPDFNRW